MTSVNVNEKVPANNDLEAGMETTHQKMVDVSPLNSIETGFDQQAPEPFYGSGRRESQADIRRRLSTISVYQTVEEQQTIANVLAQRNVDQSKPMPNMGGGRPFPPSLPDLDNYRVAFDGPDDPRHPFNWPSTRKTVIALILSLVTFTSAWGSSIFSPTVSEISKLYHVRPVVASLGVSVYVMGFASGPVLWSPLSELYGRRLPVIISMLMFTCFSFACATAKDLQTIIITRFFTGMSGSSPLTLVAAIFADMFSNQGRVTRGAAIDLFAMAVFAGPMISPIVGGFVVESYLGWRWTMYLTGILGALSLILVVLFVKETYAPLILVDKAMDIRERTGNWGVHAVHEHVRIDLHEIMSNTIARPIKMLFSEPIILLIAIYNGFTYLILYLCLSSYPYAYVGKYHWSLSMAMIPYVGILTGEAICCAVMILYFEPKYKKADKEGTATPEMRLAPVLPAAIAFPIGLFWFFWSSNYAQHCHWIVPSLSGLFTGYGLMGILVPSINYIVDAYLFFAASALASLTLMRSMLGASSPLFATYMFNGIHLNWSGLLLGLVAVGLAPVPFIFHKFGARIRGKSKYAFTE